MARGPSYRIPFRRRKEGKTDYKARRALIISRLPRVVTRRSLKHMSVQIIEATSKGDRVVVSAHSRELEKYGWQAACANLPSAYLTGLLCGVRAAAQKVTKAVADIGLNQPTKGARVFASLSGVIDAGVDVPHDPSKLPSQHELKGQHIADYAKKLASSDVELFEQKFSQYLKRKIPPEKLVDHFETVKGKIAAPPKKKSRKKRGKSEKQ